MSDELVAQLTSLELRLKEVFALLDTPEWAEIEKDVIDLAHNMETAALARMEASESASTHSYCSGRISAIKDMLTLPYKARENIRKEMDALRNKLDAKIKKRSILDNFREK